MNSAERHEARYKRRKAARDLKRYKRIHKYDDFNSVFSFDNLYDGYKNSIRGVQWKASTQIYKSNAIVNIAESRKSLLDGTFRSMGFMNLIYLRGVNIVT